MGDIDVKMKVAVQAPELSVLLVNWNTREMTLECLRSLYAETRQTRFECIVTDNGSQDGSAEAIASEFPQVRLFAEKDNHGFAGATNLQIREVQAPMILLLNTDTVVMDGAIDKLMAFARETPEAGIWGGRTIFQDGRYNPTSCWRRITPWSAFCFASGLVKLFPESRIFNPERIDFVDGRIEEVDIVTGCLFLISRDFWNKLGGFDPAFFMYGEEADLCLRAHALGARPLATPAATIIHHGGASAASRALKIIQMHGARAGLSQRHISGVGGKFASEMLVMGAWLRKIGYGIAARLSGKPAVREAADNWSTVWEKRNEWRNGPKPPQE